MKNTKRSSPKNKKASPQDLKRKRTRPSTGSDETSKNPDGETLDRMDTNIAVQGRGKKTRKPTVEDSPSPQDTTTP